MASHPNKHSNGKTIGYKHKSQLKPTGAMGYNSRKMYEKVTFNFNRNDVAFSDL